MATIRVGLGGLPSRDSPDASVEQLLRRGYDACEIDFGDGFWMDWDFARRLGEVARKVAIRLSVHAPLAAFLGSRRARRPEASDGGRNAGPHGGPCPSVRRGAGRDPSWLPPRPHARSGDRCGCATARRTGPAP